MAQDTKYIDTPVWDKTFAKSEKVNHRKVAFKNRYGIELVGDLYSPKNLEGNAQYNEQGLSLDIESVERKLYDAEVALLAGKVTSLAPVGMKAQLA